MKVMRDYTKQIRLILVFIFIFFFNACIPKISYPPYSSILNKSGEPIIILNNESLNFSPGGLTTPQNINNNKSGFAPECYKGNFLIIKKNTILVFQLSLDNTFHNKLIFDGKKILLEKQEILPLSITKFTDEFKN